MFTRILVSDPLTTINNQKTILQDFIEILKYLLQSFSGEFSHPLSEILTSPLYLIKNTIFNKTHIIRVKLKFILLDVPNLDMYILLMIIFLRSQDKIIN